MVKSYTSLEIFYNSKQPYTWALLSSLPQLGKKGEDLFSIKGTPPNLFKKVKGDAYAPRNPSDLKIAFGKRRNKTVDVNDVSFDIYKGETFGLVGE